MYHLTCTSRHQEQRIKATLEKLGNTDST